MAGIDYTIPGQFKGIQIESPMNAMTQAMQLRNLQETSQLNALRAQEYELKTQDAREMSRQRNALAQYLANPKKPTNPLELEAGVRGVAPLLADQWVESQLKRGELEEKINERGFKNFERKFKLYQSVTPNIRSIDDVSKFVAASYQDPDLGPILKQIRPYEDAINANQDAFNEDPDNWRLQAAGVSAKDIAEIARTKQQEKRLAKQEERAAAEAQQKERDRVAPKWELRKIGDREVLVNVNPYSETVGQIKPGAEALVDDTPKWTARDIGGSIVYVDENPFSKTFGTQKTNATLTKTAAPAPVTESALTRLERELAEAVKTHGTNSSQAKNIRNKIEQETGGLERQRIGIDRQRLNLERYKASKGDGSGRGPGPGTKLEKGEVWNEAEQRIETVPGSKLNIAQSNAHGKDRSSLVAVETKTNSAINKIDEILDPENQAGFDANFSGMVPYGGFVTGRFAPDTRRNIESLKADMKSAGLDLIRQGGSIGQITEREWPILEAMIAGISPEMTPDAARKEFIKVRAYMNRLKDNARDAYETEWGDTQYFKPAPGDKTPRPMSAQDKQALNWATANPKDPRSAQIKQRLGVK